MSLWLTREELAELTGYVQPAAQIRWLQKNGIHHTVRADGKPRVLPQALLPQGISGNPIVQPNFDAVRVRH